MPLLTLRISKELIPGIVGCLIFIIPNTCGNSKRPRSNYKHSARIFKNNNNNLLDIESQIVTRGDRRPNDEGNVAYVESVIVGPMNPFHLRCHSWHLVVPLTERLVKLSRSFLQSRLALKTVILSVL